jgi:hypothetical protein
MCVLTRVRFKPFAHGEARGCYMIQIFAGGERLEPEHR